jgi:hypothetical protein
MDASDDLRFDRATQRTRELTEALATLDRVRGLLIEHEIDDPCTGDATLVRKLWLLLGVRPEEDPCGRGGCEHTRGAHDGEAGHCTATWPAPCECITFMETIDESA